MRFNLYFVFADREAVAFVFSGAVKLKRNGFAARTHRIKAENFGNKVGKVFCRIFTARTDLKIEHFVKRKNRFTSGNRKGLRLRDNMEFHHFENGQSRPFPPL